MKKKRSFWQVSEYLISAKQKVRCIFVAGMLLLGSLCLGACSQRQQTKDDSGQSVSEQEKPAAEEITSSPSVEIEKLSGLQELGQQNIVSDGEYLYTVHRQMDETDLVQIFGVGENGLETIWSVSMNIGVRLNIDGGFLQAVYPENSTEEHIFLWEIEADGKPQEIENEIRPWEMTASSKPAEESGMENIGKNETITTEYPFGRDLDLLLEVQTSSKETTKIKLQMIHPSTGERLQKLSFSVNNTDWTERIAENIIVDHQHCYLGIGSQNKQGQHLYQLYHYSEENGFRKLMEYNWGKNNNPWESCGWIRGNDVYIFSPDGRKSVVYNVVTEEIT